MLPSKIRFIFRVIFIAFFAAILLFVLYQNFNPFGVPRFYNYEFSPKINHFINPLLPKERVSEYYRDAKGDWYQALKGPLVYFSLYPVTQDWKLDLAIKYKSEVPEIRFGEVVSAGDNLEYKPYPFYNAFIQNLDWPCVENNGVFLYQKEKHFNSVQEYLGNVPLDKNNAVYFFGDERIKNAKSFTHFQNPAKEIDYLITIYKKAKATPDGWLITTMHLNLSNSFILRQSVRYLFSIPFFENYVASSGELAPEVAISSIKAVVYEPPSRYFLKFQNLFRNRP
ncbi:MAG: hypothetical protein WC650_00525 [Candidatus Doudnabacteria bacterium]